MPETNRMKHGTERIHETTGGKPVQVFVHDLRLDTMWVLVHGGGMRLTRDQARLLAADLQEFAETGRLDAGDREPR